MHVQSPHIPFLPGTPGNTAALFRAYRPCIEYELSQANHPSINDATTHHVYGGYWYFGKHVDIRADPDALAELQAKYVP